MRLGRQFSVQLSDLGGPLLAGATWSAAALASSRLIESGAVPVVWLPSGVAVAAYFATPKRHWPLLVAVLAAFQFATLLWTTGSLAGAIGYTLDSQAEALVCGSLAIRLIGGRKRSPRTYRHVVGLFAIAMLGSAAGALVALPFRPVDSPAELLWRFLATVLGVLAGAPAVLALRQWLGFGNQQVRVFGFVARPYFGVTLAALAALGTVVLVLPYAALVPLLFVAIMFAAIRYGQLASVCGVIAYAAAATGIGLSGHSPAALFGLGQFGDGLEFQALLLAMLAATLPIAAMLLTRERLEEELRAQNAALQSNLTILSLAESLAGIGRWRYNVRDGTQVWSPRMLEMNGLPAALAPDPGDVRRLLPDGGAQLFGQLAAHRDAREPYGFEYRIVGPGGRERILMINVTNEFDDADERTAVFAVAKDVTEQVEREKALLTAREQAITLAAESQVLANTDPLTGLSNRRSTFDWLDRLIRASADVDEPLSLVIFDIDHFKRINDCFGHQTGDEVLKKVSRIARGVMRGDDLVGRIGGEEFVCLLPGLDLVRARALAERLRLAVADGSVGDGLPVATISLGLALHRAGDDGPALVARADAALYEAKEAGRNQVRRAA
ncbi:MAG: diguanylate cyclase [Croceibacterium sp.]